VAVLSLALGIGINTTIFSVVNAVLLKPLPVEEPGRLVEVYMSDSDGYPYSSMSFPDYRDIRDQSDVFEGLIASELTFYHFSLEDVTEMVFGEAVTGNYFDVLGVPAGLGRTFLPEEYENPGTHPVAVLGHSFWERRFAGAPGIVGGTIKLNGQVITVIGVAPESFTGTIPVYSPDIWTTMSMQTVLGLEGPDPEALEKRGHRSLFGKGRLESGVTIEQAEAELNTIMARLGEAYPKTNEGRTAHLIPTNDVRLHPFVDEAATPVALLLMVVVGMVLLIACANVANMLLAKASVRRREIAVRLAVGASRFRLLRQLLTESVILALIGGALGMLLAYWCVNLIYVVRPPIPISMALDLGIDVRVLLFTLLVSLVTGIFFGLAPALQASRQDLVSSLKDESSRSGTAGRRLSLRNLLVVGQVAVSLVLLIAAGLFLRSVRNAYDIDPGFETEKIAVLTYNLGLLGYSDDQMMQFAREGQEKLASVPGAVSTAMTGRVPLGFSVQISGLVIEGHELPLGDDDVDIDSTKISPGYFEVMGVPLIAGRNFTDEDVAGSVPVVIINETMARRFWPGENPIGKRLRRGGDTETWYEIIGVCRDYKIRTLGEEARPYVHWAFHQDYDPFQIMMVRTAGDPGPMLETFRRELRSIEPGLVFMDVRTMPENMAVTLYPVQVGATLLSVFGFLALGMAAVGLYGVIAYSVSQRTHEFGLRMALGAQTADVLRLVVRQGMILVAVGIALGLAGAMAVTWVLSSVLYGISAVDPVTFGATSLFLAAVAFMANWLPAHRAAKTDPMTALRYE
jgi:predicted permease